MIQIFMQLYKSIEILREKVRVVLEMIEEDVYKLQEKNAQLVTFYLFISLLENKTHFE
jgi:hypothetical protein